MNTRLLLLGAAAFAWLPGLVHAQEDVCAAPGRTILTDLPADALSAQGAHEIEKLSIAQPDGASYKLVFTLKMKDLSTVPPNTIWPVTFCSPALPCTDPNAAVSATNKPFVVRMVSPGPNNPGTVPIFQVRKPNAADTTVATVVADPASNFTANGTITIVANAADLGLTDVGAGTETLERFLIRVNAGGVTPDNMPNETTGGGGGQFTTVAPGACTADSDDDGVVDANDACPATPTGANVDVRGCPAAPPPVPAGDRSQVSSGGVTLTAKVFATNGWVRPGASYPLIARYHTGAAAAAGLTSVAVTLHDSAVFLRSTPMPDSGTGVAGNPLIYTLGVVAPNTIGKIVIEARAKDLDEDPEVIWKDVSADAALTVVPNATVTARSRGPHVTTLSSARFGDRPFPVVNVQYADVSHCTGAGTPLPECTGNNTASELDDLINSRTSGNSVWQHFNDISLGKLNPIGTVSASGKTTVPFGGIGQHKFARLAPAGTCGGTTRAGPPQPQGQGVDGAGKGGADGTPTYPNRIENGWYTLPGTQAYYGSDKYGHGIGGALTGVGAVFGIDDGCGPTGKLAYDAASLADPDVDYNDFDTDRDGLVDFFEILFAGCGGNGCVDPSGVNNVWPHSSSLEFYFVDALGQKGYVSDDQLRNLLEQPLWWTTAGRTAMTTTDMGDALKVFVRVGRYNVNPETAFDFTSVISHEYGHSLGLPDFYSLGDRETFGGWELMATDHSQYMTGYARQKMGWIVPQMLSDGTTTLRESKFDTNSIKWRRPDGTPYELTGPDVHNADLFKVRMPNPPLLPSAPDGTRASHSGAGNDFGCPPDGGHGLLIAIPDMEQHADATSASLSFKTMYEIEWDYDYGFVLASTDNGQTWQSLPSANGTTISGYNPNANGCFTTYGNAITGVSGESNTPANANRAQGTYPAARWIDDRYDLSAFKGQKLLLLLSYATDPGLAKRGWFVDSVSVTVTKPSGVVTLYQTGFEVETQDQDSLRLGALGSGGWRFLSTVDGGDADHAYYLELRDRLSWDYQGKGQNDRGNVAWQPGVSMVYTNEATGYGNTDGVNPPHQSPVDAAPTPGDETPNLNDAAFTLARPEFNGCTHIDNYVDPNGPDENWKLPGSLRFTVTDISGLGAGDALPSVPATATIVAEVDPICDLLVVPPVLSFEAGYENPDTDGAYELGWTRPPDAVGPDLVQEATLNEALVSDNAEGGLGQWTVTRSDPAFSPNWEASTARPKPGHTGTAFYANPTSETETQDSEARLTFKNPIAIPPGVNATLTFREWYFNEDDDRAFVEISPDGGANWDVVYSNARPMGALPDEGATAFAEETLTARTIDLSAYAGQTVRLRFRFVLGVSNFVFFTQYGWYVDDIQLRINNFTDLVTTGQLTTALSGKSGGTYYYRVRTRYPAGPAATIPSDWSNVLTAVVDIDRLPVAVAPADFTAAELAAVALDGSASGDPDGEAVTYQWEQVAGPPVLLNNATTDTANFTAPAVCADVLLRFRLTVGNAGGSATDEVSVIVDNANNPPTANAGTDFEVQEGDAGLLSGALSGDDDCEALQYAWTQIDGPDASLEGADSATPSFTAPQVDADTVLRFRLTVTDAAGVPSSDEIRVTVIDSLSIGNNQAGSLPPATVLLLGLLGLARRRRG